MILSYTFFLQFAPPIFASTICSVRRKLRSRHYPRAMPDIQEMEPFSTLWLNVTPETWSRGGELQGAGRCKDVASSLASCWDLLSVCLQADWADWPHFAPYARMGGLPVTSNEGLCVMASPDVQHIYVYCTPSSQICKHWSSNRL